MGFLKFWGKESVLCVIYNVFFFNLGSSTDTTLDRSQLCSEEGLSQEF